MTPRSWVLASTLALTAPMALGQPDQEGYARARLIAEHRALTPGKTATLGLSFEIEPGWHIYSNALNDSGFPVKLTLEAPAGYKVGQVQWPAPVRLVSPGGILDHVYEDRITLLIPVEVPAAASGTASFTGSAEWLICKEACLPGAADLRLEIPVGGQSAGKPSPDSAPIAQARERLPRPLPNENPPISWRLDNDIFEITAGSAREMHFYPAEDCVRLVDPIKDATTKSGRLRLRLADMSLGPRLKGVLELKPQGSRKSSIYAIDLPIAAAAPVLVQPPP